MDLANILFVIFKQATEVLAVRLSVGTSSFSSMSLTDEGPEKKHKLVEKADIIVNKDHEKIL